MDKLHLKEKNIYIIIWLINFNGMSSYLGLFYS